MLIQNVCVMFMLMSSVNYSTFVEPYWFMLLQVVAASGLMVELGLVFPTADCAIWSVAASLAMMTIIFSVRPVLHGIATFTLLLAARVILTVDRL